MNIRAVEKIANAVLYEGYMLYPYRPSAVKNQQRFNFGVLYPREYCELQLGSECLGDADRMSGVGERFHYHRGESAFPATGNKAGVAGRAGAGRLDVRRAHWNPLNSSVT